MGKIVLNLGEPRPDAGLVSRDLLDAGGIFAVNATATKVAYPLDAATQINATDNQIIRLQDGSLLALKNGYTWSDVSPRPAWFDTVDIRYGINPDGSNVTSQRARNAVYLFHSTDAGQSWKFWSMIDPAQVADGKYSWPGPYFDKDKNFLGYSVGGFDRTELYQDPWTGSIYVSGQGGGGPFPLNGTIYEYHAGVIFRWNKTDKKWETYHEFTEKGSRQPHVMTSTFDHRLIVFHVMNGIPTLHYVENGIMSDGKTIIASERGKPLNWNLAPTESEVGDIEGSKSQVCIARIGSAANFDRVWVAYPSVNASNMQTYVVVQVTFGGTSNPQVNLAANVTAENPATCSAMMGAFVYDDMADPDNQNTDPSCTLFYWVDTPRSSSADKDKLLVRYQVFQSGQSSPPGYLSVNNGNKRYFARTMIGHYFSGGYFWMGNELNFLAQWKEPDGIKGNIVSLPPSPVINFYKELMDLILLPYPDPARRELIDVRVRRMSIAQRKGLVTRLKGIQSNANQVLEVLDAASLTEDITGVSL
jgi:hypothetical protein